MTTVYKYKIYCNTEATYVYTWAESEPTLCPNNTSHTINSNTISIIEENKPDVVSIKEETTPTGGHFHSTTLVVTGTQNQTTSNVFSFPHDISLLSTFFTINSTHTNDTVDIAVGGVDNTIGSLSADISPASAWTSQNYVVDNIVTYNNKTYSCIQNTVSNEDPTNVSYWRRGIVLNVSSTVVTNTQVGYFIKLTDGTNTDDVGRVLHIDTNKIFVESNLTNSFLSATPTYVKQTIYMVKNYQLGLPSSRSIGSTKIGGSYIPADTTITILYTNKSTTTDKTLIGQIEYLY